MPTEYRLWWDSFQTGNNQHQAYKDWFADHKDMLPSTVTSMISVGAGCGDLDAEIIGKSLPGLQSYTGVEPDPDNRETLTENMTAQCPNVQLQVISERVPEWQGPSGPVDLVLAVQVFYYFPDKVAALQQMYSWLRPGGVLIIGHNHDDNIYANVAKEAGLVGDYWMPSLKLTFEQAGLRHFKEYKMAYTVDQGSMFNEEMARRYCRLCLLKGKCSNEANIKKCVDILRTRFEKSDQHRTFHNGILLLEKLPFSSK